MYLKILACKYQAFLGNRDTYASFHWSTVFTFSTGFVANSTIHTICGFIITSGQMTHRTAAISNCKLLILLVQECMVTSQIFRSQSFFQFLAQYQMKAEISWRTFCRIGWSENWTWFYCLYCGDQAYPYVTSLNFLISQYKKLDS